MSTAKHLELVLSIDGALEGVDGSLLEGSDGLESSNALGAEDLVGLDNLAGVLGIELSGLELLGGSGLAVDDPLSSKSRDLLGSSGGSLLHSLGSSAGDGLAGLDGSKLSLTDSLSTELSSYLGLADDSGVGVKSNASLEVGKTVEVLDSLGGVGLELEDRLDLVGVDDAVKVSVGHDGAGEVEP